MENGLINGINYLSYSTNFLNHNQYGFTPQRSTIGAAIVVNDFVEGLNVREVITLESLDVKGVFHAAWWPNILKNLQDCGRPKNLYNLTERYFSHRTAILSTNRIGLARERTRRFPKGHGAARDYGTSRIIY